MAKKRVVKAMSKEDFLVKKGTVKESIERGVTINDKVQNLTITTSKNHKKGTFHIEFKWNMDAITNDDFIDTATLDSMNQMMMAARNECLQWRDAWKNEREDPDQLDMNFGEDDDD